MLRSALSVYRCPESGRPLELLAEGLVEERGRVKSGTLRAAGGGRGFPVRDFVPRFVDGESYAASFGVEWNLFSRVQLDSANGTRISRLRFEALTGYPPEHFRGKRVLEAGCGSGRFLELLAAAGAEVWGVDLSSAIDPCRRNLERFEDVNLAQADLARLPFAPGTFDFLFCFGVLMCTPDTRASTLALFPYVKPGGEVCTWVYGYRGPRWIPRPYQVYGQLVRRLPERLRDRVLRLYPRATLPLRRIPLLGRPLRAIFPVSDIREKRWGEDGYNGGEPVPDRLVGEWALLNTYDAFTPAQTRQHDFDEVEAWWREAGLVDIRRRPVRVALIARRAA
jgi:SAM-dependent methyltransferase